MELKRVAHVVVWGGGGGLDSLKRRPSSGSSSYDSCAAAAYVGATRVGRKFAEVWLVCCQFSLGNSIEANDAFTVTIQPPDWARGPSA
ncbi:hypothetical protein KY285_023202 [Solanum tuberosum]|nr:hypothetical protein KY284_023300 [Solanum tuberosum]KAH0675401.1 hypothetical protein KY285_023202 [Solanum tuberosum]